MNNFKKIFTKAEFYYSLGGLLIVVGFILEMLNLWYSTRYTDLNDMIQAHDHGTLFVGGYGAMGVSFIFLFLGFLTQRKFLQLISTKKVKTKHGWLKKLPFDENMISKYRISYRQFSFLFTTTILLPLLAAVEINLLGRGDWGLVIGVLFVFFVATPLFMIMKTIYPNDYYTELPWEESLFKVAMDNGNDFKNLSDYKFIIEKAERFYQTALENNFENEANQLYGCFNQKLPHPTNEKDYNLFNEIVKDICSTIKEKDKNLKKRILEPDFIEDDNTTDAILREKAKTTMLKQINSRTPGLQTVGGSYSWSSKTLINEGDLK